MNGLEYSNHKIFVDFLSNDQKAKENETVLLVDKKTEKMLKKLIDSVKKKVALDLYSVRNRRHSWKLHNSHVNV